jgi:hypothetical protein
MSNRSAYRHRVARVFAAVLGLAVLPQARAAAAIDKADLERLSVSEKLAAIREATTIASSGRGRNRAARRRSRRS